MALLALLVLTGYTAFYLIPSTNRERAFLEQKLEETQAMVGNTQEQIELKRAFLHKLNTDPEFLERVAREKLSYIKAGEHIIRFEEEE